MASTWTTNKQEHFKQNEIKKLENVVFLQANGVEGFYSKQEFSSTVKGFKLDADDEVSFADGGETLYWRFKGNTAVEVAYA